MGRKPNPASGLGPDAKQQTVIARRLDMLIADADINELKGYIGVTPQALNQYRLGQARPSLENLCKIATFFGVTTDYLLGLTDDPAPKPSAVDDLGLSPKAVQYLLILRDLQNKPPYDDRSSFLSDLLENLDFDRMLALCMRYTKLLSVETDTSFWMSPNCVGISDTLKDHGLVISTPAQQANALFSEEIVGLLRKVLQNAVPQGQNKDR